ncbi:hypothetical protein DFP72DRAFT_801577, partial [Ephemerocybe angulata]
MNAIGIENLRRPYAEGGVNLLDVRARNDAVALTVLQSYMKSPPERPVWAYLVDHIFRLCAVRRYQTVDSSLLINPFVQSWDVYTQAKGLPLVFKRMYSTGRKYSVSIHAWSPQVALQLKMPYWWHVGTKGKLVSVYNDKWGKCIQRTHHLSSVGDLLAHANKNQAATCSERVNCACINCIEDRALGCEHPPKCRRNAGKKLSNLLDIWNPLKASQYIAVGAQPQIPGQDPEWTPVVPMHENYAYPHEAARIFTLDAFSTCRPTLNNEHMNNDIAPSSSAEGAQVITVWTDGSCSDNGTKYAAAGSGLWYHAQNARNRAIRLPGEYLTNNIAEVMAVIAAIQDNGNVPCLRIITD